MHSQNAFYMQQYPFNLLSVYKTSLYHVVYIAEFKMRQIKDRSLSNESFFLDRKVLLYCADIHGIESQSRPHGKALHVTFKFQVGLVE